VWFGGREFATDERGEAVIPFSTRPGRRPLILNHGRLSTLDFLDHASESYTLEAGIHVPREALLGGQSAQILVRPVLSLNGRAIAIALLDDPTLTITAVDLDGVAATTDVRGLELSDTAELIHEIAVPERLVSLSVRLRGKVKSLTADDPVDVASAPATFDINGIDTTLQTDSALLSRIAEGYAVDLRGKNGEVQVARPLQVTMRHRDYTETVDATLMTDEAGRIHLGSLEGIEWIMTRDARTNHTSQWALTGSERTVLTVRHARAGEDVLIPYQGHSSTVDRSVLSALELRGGQFRSDVLAQAAMRPGYVVLQGLAPGDYDVLLKESGDRIRVVVTSGAEHAGWAMGPARSLDLRERLPLQITEAVFRGDTLDVQLAHGRPGTRVHIYTSRYLPAFDPFAHLDAGPLPRLGYTNEPDHASSYHSGREIGDEYRYILERRFATKFPGNMLDRPSMLLNPWALPVSVWNSAGDTGEDGAGNFRGRGSRRQGGGPGEPSLKPKQEGSAPNGFANLDFLGDAALVLANLTPDDEGRLQVPLQQLGDGHLVHVVVVDPTATIYRQMVRREQPLQIEDQRLARALAQDRHFSEQRRIEYLGRGDRVDLTADAAQVATYDSLTAVHQLLFALTDNVDLAKFAFVLRWPDLSDDEKRALYSEHACHELHFFLHHKDPAFFAAVVRPYLANKAHMSFLDHWLLEADLSKYLEPWQFGRLNAVERILLARRLTAEADSIRRYGDELLELRPADPTLLDRLFQTALGQAAFDRDGLTHELTKNLDAIREMQESAGRPSAPPTSGAPRRAITADPQAPADAPKARGGLADDAEPANEAKADLALGRALAERSLDLDRRSGESRAFYRAPRPTEQLVEQHYWRINLPDQTPALVDVNRFWGDYAAAKGERFVSPHVAEATGSFAEMMLALAVLDLPFKAGEHSTERLDNGVRLVAASPLLLVRKDLVDVAVADDATPILVSQNLFRQDARYRYVGNERLDAFVTDEFVKGVAYGCQVVVTNPTSAPRQLELLLQIPQGALPLQRGFETKGKALRLDPYGTASVEYGFYFPEAGSMPHYPVQISEAGRLIAFADGRNLNVVAEATAIDTDSWAHVSQQGTRAEVLAYLRSANLQRTDLSQIAWRMGDRAFFVATLELLRQRHVFHERLWSYGLRHGDERAVREYLPNASGFVAACGEALESALLTLDPEERRVYQHTEFAPWINQRAHPFGNEWNVTSANISAQYARFMNILCQRPVLDDDDWMSVSYYMLLLDRVEDGLAAFAKVDPQRLTTRLQYDYMQAYVSFYSEDYDLARRIAQRHVDHPVDRWRHRFRDVIAQLDEAAGATILAAGPAVDQNALAASEPSLELDVEARRVSLQYRNVTQCEVSYYEMDVEFLFSTRPFVQDESRSFAYIKPHLSETRTLDPEASDLAFDLPEQFRNANVLVEVRAGGVVRRQPYFANSLTVHTLETYGQVQVAHADTDQPLRKVYIKVFARQPNGSFRFYKDGYTDLRGRFDYASIGTSEAIAVDRFAVLVLSEDHGATIREMSPPTQ